MPWRPKFLDRDRRINSEEEERIYREALALLDAEIRRLSEVFGIDETGTHRHRCPDCLTVWKHSNRCALISDEVHRLAHACPKCGTEVTLHYRGDNAPSIQQECTYDRGVVPFVPVVPVVPILDK